MNDPRFDQLAKNLVGFSVSLRKGDRLLIDAFDIPDTMVIALIRAARAVGAVPFVHVHHMRVTREMARAAQEEGLDLSSRLYLGRNEVDAGLHRAPRW